MATPQIVLRDSGKLELTLQSGGRETLFNPFTGRVNLRRKQFLDPLVSAFAAESGATDLAGLDALIKYVRAEGLLDNFVIYPMKAAQNAGSGSTVYSLGGLTGNDMTLLNSPTWGAGGISFNGTNQYGRVDDFLGSDTITAFVRFNAPLRTDALAGLIAQYDTGANQRSFILCSEGTLPGDPVALYRSSLGTFVTAERYTGDPSDFDSSDVTAVAQWIDGGGRSLWRNKTPVALSLSQPPAQTQRFDSPTFLTVGSFMSNASPTGFQGGLYTVASVVRGSINDTQRETITDLINAL